MENLLINSAVEALGRTETNAEFYYGASAAAILCSNGNIYTGKSLNISCGLGFCGEQAAVAKMISDNETKIDMVVAVNDIAGVIAPCGKCREMMMQIDKRNIGARIFLSFDKIVSLKDLLPYSWQLQTLG